MNATRVRTAWTLAVLAMVSIPLSAQADARRSGLAGSLLIEDRDDIYFFPQRLAEHRNLVALTYGGTGASGSGLFTLGGDSSVLGLAIHRGDVQTPHLIADAAALTGPSNLFGAPFTLAPATIVDLLYAARLGSSELGLRLAIGSGEQSTTMADRASGQSDTLVMAEVGYGWGERGSSTRVDIGAALALDFANQEVLDSDTESGSFFGLSALLRAFVPFDQTLDLGVLGSLRAARTAISDETLAGDPAASQLAIDVGGGLGPALSFGRVSVAAYAVLGLRLTTDDTNDDIEDDETTSHTILFPGVHMALEVPLSDWFFVRTGAQYNFNWRGASAPQDSGSSQRGSSFGWNAGLGVVIDQFRFDGSLQQGFVTGGPDFIGGTGAGFLALATLSYSFDHLRNPPPTAEAPRLEPAPPLPPSADAPSAEEPPPPPPP